MTIWHEWDEAYLLGEVDKPMRGPRASESRRVMATDEDATETEDFTELAHRMQSEYADGYRDGYEDASKNMTQLPSLLARMHLAYIAGYRTGAAAYYEAREADFCG